MQLFRGEFIFPPEGLTTNLEKTLAVLEKDEVIQATRDASGTPQSVELHASERLCGRENYDFYCFLIWPFIEASWLGAVSLLGLTPPLNTQNNDMWVDFKKAQDSAQIVSWHPFLPPPLCFQTGAYANIPSSLGKHCSTKAIFRTLKQ